MTNETHERIRKRLEKLGKSPQAASVEAGLSKEYLRSLFNRETSRPNGQHAVKLAKSLQTSVDWLLTGEGQEEVGHPQNQHEQRQKTADSSIQASHPVPVMGKAAGAVIGASNIAEAPIEYINLPVATATIKDIYALWVEGTSMLEKYEPGEPIVVAPHRTVRANDFVVVQLMQDGELRALVKRFLSRDEHRVKLQQFNPNEELEIPHEQIHAVHRILSLPEVIGLSI